MPFLVILFGIFCIWLVINGDGEKELQKAEREYWAKWNEEYDRKHPKPNKQ